MGTQPQRIRAIPPVMVFKANNGDQLVFTFRSMRWGVITGIVTVFISVLACHVLNDVDVPLVARLFVFAIDLAFAYSTFFSFTTRRSLEINFTEKVVRLLETNLFGAKRSQKPFSQYRQITICKPDYNSINYAIMLESSTGEIEYLGWNEFGAGSLESAMDLANQIAAPMGIEINAPSS
jgi:hypothetical protein